MPVHADIGIRHRRATVGGLGHHYVTAGAGPALVLLHGFPQTSRQWHPLIQRLGGRFRVIAPDLRGIGGLPGPASGYDKFTLSDDIKGIVEQAGADDPY